MTEFTPISGGIGGLLIGSAAALLLLRNGRVAGISGILGQALWPASGEKRDWRIAFLLGMPVGAAIVSLLVRRLAVEITASPLILILAGLLVGFGTRLGNGCTSGHGVCGIARGSRRSLVATASFMAAGAVTVFVARHLLGAA